MERAHFRRQAETRDAELAPTQRGGSEPGGRGYLPPTAAVAPSAAEGAGPGAGTVLSTAKAAKYSLTWPDSPCLPMGYLGAKPLN